MKTINRLSSPPISVDLSSKQVQFSIRKITTTMMMHCVSLINRRSLSRFSASILISERNSAQLTPNSSIATTSNKLKLLTSHGSLAALVAIKNPTLNLFAQIAAIICITRTTLFSLNLVSHKGIRLFSCLINK